MDKSATTWLLVALLGAAGSVLRFAVSGAAQRVGGRFPLGTLSVNLLGSFAIGAVMAIYAARHELDARSRIAITAGLLGGFTTYSSFAYETVALAEARATGLAALNLALTTVVCLSACMLGLWAGRALTR
jgi:CrcB protein